MYKRRGSLSGNEARFFPQENSNPRESILFDSQNSNGFRIPSDLVDEDAVEEEDDFADFGDEDNIEAAIRSLPIFEKEETEKEQDPTEKETEEDLEKEEEKEDVKTEEKNEGLRKGRRRTRDKGANDDDYDSDIIEFVKLVERSRSSMLMKPLLLRILNENKFEKLKPFLEDSSSDLRASRKRSDKTGLDSTSYHRRQGGRRMTSRQSDLHSSGVHGLRNSSGHGMKSTRRTMRTSSMHRGPRNNMSSRMNDDQVSPGAGLSRSRPSTSASRLRSKRTSESIRKHRNSQWEVNRSSSGREGMQRLGSDQKLSGNNDSSSSFGADLSSSKRRNSGAGSLLKGEQGSSGKQNAHWNLLKSSGGKDALLRIGSDQKLSGNNDSSSSLKVDVTSGKSPASNGKQNAHWDLLKSSAGRNALSMLHKKMNSDDDDSSSSPSETEDAFVAPLASSREQTVGLHSLLDDLRLGKDSNSSNKDDEDAEDTKAKKNKSILKFQLISKQLKLMGMIGNNKDKDKDKQTAKFNNSSLSDEKDPKDANENSMSSLNED
ncbi:unnamed protein product [Pseudo-nitzschia multistriata]|uniref:Uncharacterized protein n=1 Tax=Pseudo-nitzschia multistriata TaxID=183589 RepID=A0A448Z6L1_9STRA|nr:unnamed protein product [Pseudo-nitzschia multistriata]